MWGSGSGPLIPGLCRASPGLSERMDACPGDVGQTDRQALPGCFTWNRAQKVPELASLSGREIPGEWAASAKIKGAFTDSQLPNTCCSSWTDSSGTVLHIYDIYHKLISIINWLRWNLPFPWWYFWIKTKVLPWLGSFLSHILSWKPPPPPTCGDTRTSNMSSFVLCTWLSRTTYVQSHNCAIVAQTVVMKDWLKDLAATIQTMNKRLRKRWTLELTSPFTTLDWSTQLE